MKLHNVDIAFRSVSRQSYQIDEKLNVKPPTNLRHTYDISESGCHKPDLRIKKKVSLFTTKSQQATFNTICDILKGQRKINFYIIKSGMGEGEKYNPIWPYHEPHEVFLEDISDSSSTCDYETEAESDLDHPVIKSYTSEAGTTNSNSRFTAPPAQKSRLKNLPELSEAKEMANALSILNRVVDDVNARHDDDCELYAKLLATKLRKFPAYEREVIMLEIDSMLMKRRLGSQSTRSNWSGSSSPYNRPNSANSDPPTYVGIPNQSPHNLPNYSPQYVLNEPQHQRILSI